MEGMADLLVRRISVVVRLFDPRLPSNRLVLIAFAGAFIVGSALEVRSGEPWTSAAAGGLQAAFAVLLSWAIAREIDPDRPTSATIAIGAGAVILLTGEARLAVVMTVMFAVRVVARSAGKPPTNADLIWLLGLCAFSSLSPAGWIGGVALGLALAWDTLLPRPAPTPSLVVGVIGVALAILVATFEGNAFPGWRAPTAEQAVVLLAGALGAIAVLSLRRERVSSVEDYSDQVMSPERLVRARGLMLGSALASLAVLGGPSASSFVGLWASMIGVGLRLLVPATRAGTEAAA
jgi:hypothetical protein